MRFLITAIVFILFGMPGKGQSSFQGEYRMKEVINDSLPYIITLKLNCNGTYVRSDSFHIAYGKWEMKKDDLILSADSVIVNNKTEIVHYKLEYENIENRFHIKSVPKKEYLDMLDEIRKVVPNTQGEKGGYQKYKEVQKAKYYEKVIGYDCK